MANKEFKIQSDTISLNGVPLSSSADGKVVLPGVTIAEGSVVGANSLVTKSTEPWTVYVGSAAKPIKKRSIELSYKFAKELGYEL